MTDSPTLAAPGTIPPAVEYASASDPFLRTPDRWLIGPPGLKPADLTLHLVNGTKVKFDDYTALYGLKYPLWQLCTIKLKMRAGTANLSYYARVFDVDEDRNRTFRGYMFKQKGYFFAVVLELEGIEYEKGGHHD